MNKNLKEFLEFMFLVGITHFVVIFGLNTYLNYKRQQYEAANTATIRPYQETPTKRSGNTTPNQAELINH